MHKLDDHDPALRDARLANAIDHVLSYAHVHGAIGLTEAHNFNRVFVNWAVDIMDWPGFRRAELERVNKVLNQPDVPPLDVIHELLFHLKILRRRKNQAFLTPLGRELVGRTARIFTFVTPVFLFEFDHRIGRGIELDLNQWDLYLGILDEYGDQPIQAEKLTEVLFGTPDGLDQETVFLSMKNQSAVRSQILTPLSWTGLLRPSSGGRAHSPNTYTKTRLWDLLFFSGIEPADPIRH
jgi:hypothetical protein